jgi:hypothetical protein
MLLGFSERFATCPLADRALCIARQFVRDALIAFRLLFDSNVLHGKLQHASFHLGQH